MACAHGGPERAGGGGCSFARKAGSTDRCFTFTNYSNGQTFAGQALYPRAMPEEELARLTE